MSNRQVRRSYFNLIDCSITSVISELIVALPLFYSNKDLTAALRRIVVKFKVGKTISFLTYNFNFKSEYIADLCLQRWDAKLFIKWTSSI